MITIDADKQDRIEKLVQALKELENCIAPFQEQRKELRTSYIENGWLTKEEYNLVKKAFNAVKHDVDLEELGQIMDLIKGKV